MSIIITGASGQLARLVVERLLTTVKPEEVVLVTRSPEGLADYAARGLQVRQGDFDHPETLATAFAGGDKLLLISTTSVGRRIGQHRRAIAAAVEAGVQHIVYTSFIGIDAEDRAFVVVDHAGTEEALQASGVAWTALRDSQYAEAVADVIAPMSLANGVWRAAAADGRIAFVSREDVADVAAHVLTTDGHENVAYEVTGPELLSYREAAALLSEVTGRPVEFQVITDDELYAGFDAMGVPRQVDENSTADIPWCSDDMVSFERAIRQGDFSALSDTVERLTGHAPRTLRSLLESRDYSAVPAPAGE